MLKAKPLTRFFHTFKIKLYILHFFEFFCRVFSTKLKTKSVFLSLFVFNEDADDGYVHADMYKNHETSS